MNEREWYELMLRTRYGTTSCLACGAPLGDDLEHLTVPPTIGPPVMPADADPFDYSRAAQG